jgi:phosphomannomutase
MSPDPAELLARARAWAAADPDPATRAEVESLVARRDLAGLGERFGSSLAFGTAGLRGPIGVGPNRMNRIVVRRISAGLACYLAQHEPKAREQGVVIGFDARHHSQRFAADAADVLARAGLPAQVLSRPLPTPVLAFAVRHMEAAAGVMITASHNPPTDNGYKVYLSDGAQLIPPADSLIAEAAHLAEPGEPELPAADRSSPVTTLDQTIVHAYLDAVLGIARDRWRALGWPGAPPAANLRVVYTPLHGVGGDTMAALFRRAGLPDPEPVPSQALPDPDFPTVAFPNPEEPGALDLALGQGDASSADLVLANDPDADRLAAAIPDPDGGPWRVLSGDELGCLLADHVLETGSGAGRLVATTVVSSTLLEAMARAAGVAFACTLTGFKWIARAADGRPGHRFTYGYEEALGYAVGDVVRDKDGLGAALALVELAALEKGRGRTLAHRLDDLARRFGLHATATWSVRSEGGGATEAMGEAMARLRAKPPAHLGSRAVTAVMDLLAAPGDLPPADVIVYQLEGGARVVLRPSGTEPKLKAYLEVVVPVPQGAPLEPLRGHARNQLAELQEDLPAITGLKQ